MQVRRVICGDKRMNREHEYRSRAAQTVDLARRASCSSDKGKLLDMAQAWLDLADRAHKVAKKRMRKMVEHPLIRARLGHNQPDAE
jgi:hypothetical protein